MRGGDRYPTYETSLAQKAGGEIRTQPMVGGYGDRRTRGEKRARHPVVLPDQQPVEFRTSRP